MYVGVCWFKTGLIHLVDLRSHANWTHSNRKRCSAIAIDCVHVIAVYYIIYIRVSYLQTIKVKISLYDIDNQLVTHLLLCGTWFGEKPFHCLASIKRIVTGTESWPVGSCNSYGLWISDCQRRRRRRRRQICRCSAVSSWQLATGNRQQATGVGVGVVDWVGSTWGRFKTEGETNVAGLSGFA